MKNILYSILFILAQSQHSFSQIAVKKMTDARTKKPYGVYLGFGMPYPSIIGINAGYNISNFRLTCAHAELETNMGSTTDFGSEYFFMPGEKWRPTLGLHAGYVDIKTDKTYTAQGFKKDTYHIYVNAGLDYVHESGYQFAVGYNQGVVANGNGGYYANLGQFF